MDSISAGVAYRSERLGGDMEVKPIFRRILGAIFLTLPVLLAFTLVAMWPGPGCRGPQPCLVIVPGDAAKSAQTPAPAEPDPAKTPQSSPAQVSLAATTPATPSTDFKQSDPTAATGTAMRVAADGAAGAGIPRDTSSPVGAPSKPEPRVALYREHVLFIIVLLAGALGALVHAATSFADYVGNRALSRDWLWWLALRLPIGMTLALVFYMLLRGGLMGSGAPEISNGDNGGPQVVAADFINPFAVAALAALAGMFSKQATDKLREIFDSLFRTAAPTPRGDGLKIQLTSVSPQRVTAGSPSATLTITGSGFREGQQVLVNGNPRAPTSIGQASIMADLTADEVATAGVLQITVADPSQPLSVSNVLTVTVQ